MNGEWKSLDTSLNTSQTTICEQLCIEQMEHGCCFLKTGVGCYWKGGADVWQVYGPSVSRRRGNPDGQSVETGKNGDEIAVRCYRVGMLHIW